MGISSRPCTAAGIGLNSTAEKEKRQSIIRQRHTAQDKYNGRRRVRWTDLPSLPPSRHHNHPTTEVDDEKQTDNPQKPTTLLPSSNAVSSFDGMDQEEGGYALARRVGRNHLSPSLPPLVLCQPQRTHIVQRHGPVLLHPRQQAWQRPLVRLHGRGRGGGGGRSSGSHFVPVKKRGRKKGGGLRNGG